MNGGQPSTVYFRSDLPGRVGNLSHALAGNAVTAEPHTHPRKRRIVLVAFGSLGDLCPYVAVALGLKACGLDVVLATGECYRSVFAAAAPGPVLESACARGWKTRRWKIAVADALRHRTIRPSLARPNSRDHPSGRECPSETHTVFGWQTPLPILRIFLPYRLPVLRGRRPMRSPRR